MPQSSELSATTRSPTSKPLTSLPSAATTPTVSCPEQTISRASLRVKRCGVRGPTGDQRKLGHEQSQREDGPSGNQGVSAGVCGSRPRTRVHQGYGVATKGVRPRAYKSSRGTHLGDEFSLVDMQVLSARGPSTLHRTVRGDGSEPTVPQTPQALTLIWRGGQLRFSLSLSHIFAG